MFILLEILANSKVLKLQQSGRIGNDISWTFNPTISSVDLFGRGEMKGFSKNNWPFKKEIVKTLNIGEEITTIEDNSCKEWIKLESVFIPNTVTTIGASSFYKCSSLKCINIPERVTSIGEKAFYECSSLTNITIPNEVSSINKETFSHCYGLSNIIFQGHTEIIEERSFEYCYNLTSFSFPSSLIQISQRLFQFCYNLENVTFTEDILIISDYAFLNCSSLTNILLPEILYSIGKCSFSNCTGIDNLTIPIDMYSLGSSCFSGCTNLNTVFYQGTTFFETDIGISDVATVFVTRSYPEETFCGIKVTFVNETMPVNETDTFKELTINEIVAIIISVCTVLLVIFGVLIYFINSGEIKDNQKEEEDTNDNNDLKSNSVDSSRETNDSQIIDDNKENETV